MAKFKKIVDIWALSTEDRAKLQPGQWIQAGENGQKGQWCGLSEGSDFPMIAWKLNRLTTFPGGWYGYFRYLRKHSKSA